MTAQPVIPLGTTPVDLHPGASPGSLLRLAVVNVVNYTADPVMVTIHAVATGDSPTNANITHKLQVPANDTVQIGRGQDFPAGTKIVGVADADDAVNAHVSAVEV